MPRSCPIGLAHESCTMACLDASFETIGHHQSNIAAVIVEPVLSAGGMIFPPKDYLQSLHRRAQAIGALFIVDEAQTGFGRCGRWFDIENYGIVPDVLVVSKTAGNGYPIGAVIVSSDVGHALEAQGFSHLSSHQNDPLAAATIHAVIDTVAEEGLVERSAEIGGYFMDALRRLQSKHEMIVDVRGRGLMIGVELGGRDGNATSLALKTALLCEARGVHLTFSYYEPVLRFIPPLVIEKKDIDLAVAVLDEVFTLLARGNVDLEPLLPKNCRSGPYVRRMNQGLTPGKIVRGLLNTPPRHWFGKFKQVL
jgi:2,2-dialkylglycine decarboxylase (pyruvate)